MVARARFRRWVGSARVLFLGLPALAACTLVTNGIVTECQTDTDCTRLGGVYEGATCRAGLCRAVAKAGGGGAGGGASIDPKLACVGGVVWPKPDADTALVHFSASDFLTSKPYEGVKIVACSKLDIECANPVSNAVLTDANGKATLTVRTAQFDNADIKMTNIGFAGYFRVSRTDLYPVIFYENPPIATERSVPLVPITNSAFPLVLQAAGVTEVPGRGQVLIAMQDCNGNPLSGATASIDSGDSQTGLYYFVQGFPSPTAVKTDTSGIAVAVNVPVGLTTVRTSAPGAATSQIGKAGVLVRASTFTIVRLPPTP